MDLKNASLQCISLSIIKPRINIDFSCDCKMFDMLKMITKWKKKYMKVERKRNKKEKSCTVHIYISRMR